MIPRTLHSIWLGNGPKPEIVSRCIESWRRVAKGFEIVEWNDDTLACEHPAYVRARRENHFAFASDIARLEILKKHGGIYLDTDVELRKPLDAFLHHRFFLGMETNWLIGTSLVGCEAGHAFLDTLLAHYDAGLDGDFIVNNVIWSQCFTKSLGARLANETQFLPGDICVYPKEFFVLPPLFCQGGFARHYALNSWRESKRRPLFKRVAHAVLGDTVYLHLAHAKAAFTKKTGA